MPIVKIQAGAELDLLNKEELGSALDKHAEDFDKMLSEGIEYMRSSFPLFNIPSRGTDNGYAGGIYELGGPEPGFIWSVKNISFIGLNSVNPLNLLINGTGYSDIIHQGLVNTGTIYPGENGFVVKGGQKIIAGATAAILSTATIVLYYMQVPIKDIGKL